VIGCAGFTARWRALIPALSSDPGETLTGIANDYERVHEIAERFRPEFTRLVPGGVGFGITGLSVWSPWNGEELSGARRGLGFVLSVGVLSVLSTWKEGDDDGAREARDHALFVGVPHESHLPRGPLFIEGVPLVIWILRPRSLRPLLTDIAQRRVNMCR